MKMGIFYFGKIADFEMKGSVWLEIQAYFRVGIIYFTDLKAI